MSPDFRPSANGRDGSLGDQGSGFLMLLFVASLIFQISVIPFNLNIRPAGRLINGAVLAIFAIASLVSFARSVRWKIEVYYTLPVLLIVIGFSINIILGISISTLGTVNILLPWLAALSIPFLKSFNCRQAWSVYYGFMFVTTVVAMLEYFAVTNNLFTPDIAETTGGIFYKGIFTIFTRLDDGVVYYRLYGVFSEPGTAAMFMLPAISYSLFYRKWGGLFLFVVGLYLTDSLGGMFGLVLTVILYLFIRLKQTRLTLFLVISLIAISGFLGYALTGRYFTETYISKDNSARVREDNVTRFITSLPSAISANPLGFRMTGESLSTLDSNENYYGSNFSVYTAFVMGGLLGLVGYTALLGTIAMASFRYLMSNDFSDKVSAVAFISLPVVLTFVFQRVTIIESVVFGFLFAQPIMKLYAAKAVLVGSRARIVRVQQ